MQILAIFHSNLTVKSWGFFVSEFGNILCDAVHYLQLVYKLGICSSTDP